MGDAQLKGLQDGLEDPSMRVLFLAPNPPSPKTGGGSLRMFHLLKFLGARYEVDLLTPALEGIEEVKRLLRDSCREMVFVPPSSGATRRRIMRWRPYEKDPALAEQIQRRLASGQYQMVQVEKPAMLLYLPDDLPIPVVLDVWAYGLAGPLRALRHETGLFVRAKNLLRVVRFGLFDAFCWPDIYCLLVVSEKDRRRCQQDRPGQKVLVVPNGVDCVVVRPGPPCSDGQPVVLFTGDMSFDPNVDAARVLALRIFPDVRRVHPNAQLHLIGRDHDLRVRRLAGPSVLVTGEVTDMVPYLRRATVYMAPHFTGAGTRTKLLEAMAAGCAIVTTSVGIEGIEAAHEREVLIADDIPSLVTAVCRLLGNPRERNRLGQAARRLVEERYDWRQCFAPLETLYTELSRLEAPSC